MEKIKLLYLTPHLSTGGMPAFLLKRIETLQKYTDANVYVVEFKNYSSEYVVQKNKIEKLCNVNSKVLQFIFGSGSESQIESAEMTFFGAPKF